MRKMLRITAVAGIVGVWLALIGPVYAQPSVPGGPTIGLGVNRSALNIGETLVVTLTTSPGTLGVRSDLYVALGIPGGGLVFIDSTQRVQFALTTFRQGAIPSAGTIEVFRVPIPAGVTPGTYAFYAVYVRAEAENPTVPASWLSNVAVASVTIIGPSGIGGGWQLAGRVNRSACTGLPAGPDTTTGTLTVTQSGGSISGNGALLFGSSPITLQLTFSGSLTGAQFSAAGTITTPQGYGGGFTMSGGFSGDQISLHFDGRLNQGESCVYTSDLSGTIRR